MSDIFTGNSLKLYYNTDTANLIPDNYKNVQVASLAAMPSVTFNSETNKIEVYNSDYSTLIVGGKTVGDLEIVVNYIPDNETHMFLDAAAENQTEFQLIIEYQTDEAGIIDYSILNGSISSYSLSGEKDAVVQKSYIFSTMNVMVRSARAVASIPLNEGSYGVGSNGVTVPQYQPDVPAGNSFIKIPSGSSGSPTSADVMGIGLIDESKFSSIALTTSGTLAIYAKNGSTAWTRIVTSPMADAKYLPLDGGTMTGILTLSTPLAITSGGTGANTAAGARTNLDVYSKAEVDAKDATINSDITGIKNDYVPKTTTVNGKELSTNITLTKGDVGLGNVTNDAQLKIASNLSDVNNVATARTNLSVYSKAEVDTTVATLVPKTTTVNGKALSANITLTATDVGLGNVTNNAQLKIASNLSDLNNVLTARANLGLTGLGIGGTPTVMATMDWQMQNFVVGGLYIVAAGGMTNTPSDLLFDDTTTITMIRIVATDGTFHTATVWPSTSTATKFRQYSVRFSSASSVNRQFWVRRIWDSSTPIPLANGGTGGTTATEVRTNLGLGTAATQDIGTSGATIPLLSTANTWTTNQSILGDLNVGASGTTSIIRLGSSAFSRDNGIGALIITSNSGTGNTGGTGLYLRPIADTNSTVQILGTGAGWTIAGNTGISGTLSVSGISTLNSTLNVNGKSNLKGSYNGNREAVDLTGVTIDLNTCFVPATTNGHEKVWICQTQGGGSGITNKPSGVIGSFWLQCASTRINGVADSGYTQILYSYETSRTYIRYGKSTSATAGTWAAWQELMSASPNGDLFVGADVPNGITQLSGSGLDTLNGMGIKQIVNGDNALSLITPNGASSKASASFRAVVYRGTYSSPQATKAEDELWLGMAGYTGSEFTVMHSAVRAYATDDWTSSSRGSGLQFQTTATGTNTRRSVWQMGAGGAFAPSIDNSFDIGGTSLRVKTIFAASGTINTSDARLKSEVRPFTENEIEAAQALADEIGFFKWKESIEIKEEQAREHCGMTVQRAIEIMESFGLVPMDYGFICYDEWEEREDVSYYDEEDKPVYITIKAGNRFSFRFDQLNLFISRGLSAKMESIEARLQALETK
ncbi:TPA: hypothetical protein QHR34_004083 [Raoultella ornithinolytica]|nr:hypothetical protein [Raoultella ornithinolytica]HDT1249912.1 hypothetical protein [Raoultella ornithinolytica]